MQTSRQPKERLCPAATDAVTRSPKPRRIGLFGNFGSNNLGNEGSLEAMLQFLRRERPQTQFVCICRFPDKVSAKHCIPTFPLSRRRDGRRWTHRLDRLMLRLPSRLLDLGAAWRGVRNIDVLIVPGTGILDDYGERPSEMPLELFSWCAIASLLRRPIVFVSIGAGPIRNSMSRWFMVSAARMASYRSYRDEASKAFVSAHGIDTTRDEVYPDIAFSLPTPDEGSEIPADAVPFLTVGVGVMSYFGWAPAANDGPRIYQAYLSKIAQFVVWLFQRGHSVRLLIGSQSDRSAVQTIRDQVSEQFGLSGTRLIAEPALSLDDVMQQIIKTDIVVATRFHNVVCALKCGKPVLSLGYANKNDDLLQEMGLVGFSQHVDAIDIELLIRQFEKAVLDRDNIARKIREGLERIQQSLGRQETRLLETVI